MEIIKKHKKQYKANLHCHSIISDGTLTPEELKEAYKSHGYSVLAITDHEYPYDHTDLSDKDFLMLTGYEAYIRPDEKGRTKPFVPEIHINLFARDPHNTAFIGFSDPFCKYEKDPVKRETFNKIALGRPREYTVDYVNEFVKVAKEHGYICSHNHPVWSLEDWEQILKYEGFFSIEMCNYGSFRENRIEYNAQLYDYLLRHGKNIFCHSSDDNHNKHPFDSPKCDSFGGFTMILADELSYDSVFRALEKGDFYSSMGPTINELVINGNEVHIETSPAAQITMFNGGRNQKTATGTKDVPVTVADFTIPDGSPFVRFSVVDFEGKYADTRGFFSSMNK